ncbi:hypothetical protein HYV50_02320 [Candidatus Pacearchaeota archaeon]|nr:hypothetical protein [Candidatus Pacearchaeota archaeon]
MAKQSSFTPLIIFAVILGIAVVLILAFALINKSENEISNTEEDLTANSDNSQQLSQPAGRQVRNIQITSSGFSPGTLEIKQGETVTFINKDSARHWPATNVHPSHRIYPGSDREKCGTAEQSRIFDACRGLSREESYQFTFTEIGAWGYHDHLNPSFTGTIVIR